MLCLSFSLWRPNPMHLTNETGLSLPIAVWLAQDDYDYHPEENYISATSLLRPSKQLILSRRIPSAQRVADVSDFLSARFGTAVHDSIEKAWGNGRANLRKMGYPAALIERVVVNPTEEELKVPNCIPVYVERRTVKEHRGFLIGGKFDIVLEEELYDFKSTSAWTWVFGGKDEDYVLQGSIYRWLNPDLIKGDHIHINFIFTDWNKGLARQKPDSYPQNRLLQKSFKLMSLADTERYIDLKLDQLTKQWKLPEEQITPCNDKELWRSDPVYKYFSDPSKTDGRSTKNFTDLGEANLFKVEKGKGVVITIPGEVKACGYCPAYDICKQKDAYNV